MKARLDAMEANGSGLADQLAAVRQAAEDSAQAAGTAGEQAKSAAEQAKSAAAGLSDLDARLGSLDQRIASAEAAVESAKADLDSFRKSVSAAASPTASGAVADTAALTAIGQRIDALEKDVASLKSSAASGGGDDKASVTSTLSQALADLKAKVAAGAPYAEEHDRIARMVPAAAGIETVGAHAAEGLPNAQGLAQELRAAIPALPQPAPPPAEDDSYLGTFMKSLSGIVTIRRHRRNGLAGRCGKGRGPCRGRRPEPGDCRDRRGGGRQARGAHPVAGPRRGEAAARREPGTAIRSRAAPDCGTGRRCPMIKLLWRFFLLVALAAGFAWIADRPGTLTIRWLGREIEMSFVAGVVVAVLAVVAIWFFWSMFRRLWASPQAVSRYWAFRKNRKGYDSLSRGIIAAGAGDAAAAAKHAAIAGNSLSDEPLVNVLAAQAAQLKGDRAAVKRIFEAMTKSPDTEALGLRGLFSEARQSGDMAAARRHAERALAANPRLAWASTAVLQLQAAAKDWNAAAATLGQQIKSGLVPMADGNRKQAAMLAAHALALEDTSKGQALELALKAHKLDPSLVPAALVAARVLITQASTRKASKILKETWVLSPHPDLAEVQAHLIPGDGPEARYDRVRDLLKEHKGGIEGAVALARAAAKAKHWDVARKALDPYVDDRPQARICALMADIEEAAGDKGRAREWLSRALNAPRDPIWVSDGVASPRWTPVSPVSGEIVPCEWKAPFEMPEQLEPDRLPQPQPAAAEPPPQEAAPRTLEAPKMVVPQRPPDDPGLPEDFDSPRASAPRSLPADG